MSKQLLRYCRNIPLKKLKQGGTLSIQCDMPVTRVKIVPEWRDDGTLSMTQWMHVSEDTEADVSVVHKADKMTSMGRAESHLAVSVFPKKSMVSSDKKGRGRETSTIGVDKTILEKVEEPMVITDDGKIQPDSKEWHGSNVKRVEYTDGVTHVSTKDDASKSSFRQEPSLTLTAVIPEKCNLSCELLKGGDIVIERKVEGDAHLVTSNGDVFVNKLRGHEISISAQGLSNTISATDLIEAQKLDISTRGRVRAKKVHGSQVNIQVDGTDTIDASFSPTNDVDDEGSLVDISSIYVAGSGSANVFVSSTVSPEKRAVRIKSHHGHVSVETNVPPCSTATEPSVELGGVNGSFDAKIQIPESSTTQQGMMAGRIHVDSLSPDSVSVVSANDGDVSLTLDRKVEADLRLLSSSEIVSFDSSVLLQDDNPDHILTALRNLDSKPQRKSEESRIRTETDAFTSRTTEHTFQNIDFVDGWVDNKSNEPDSRFDLMSKGGKIQLQGAAEQALKGFSSSHKGESEITRPLVAVATSGNIALESLSWFGAIARRYGLEEDRDDLGRTATRSGRQLVPKE